MKQVEVSILGQVYILACPDGGEALLAAAVATVDREMTAIRDAGKVKARERIAVLAALNLAYQLAERGGSGAREGSGRSAGATGGANSAASSVAHSAASSAAEHDVDLDALVQRVDAALADDGQLL